MIYQLFVPHLLYCVLSTLTPPFLFFCSLKVAPKSRKYQSTPCTVCPMGKCGCLSPLCGTRPIASWQVAENLGPISVPLYGSRAVLNPHHTLVVVNTVEPENRLLCVSVLQWLQVFQTPRIEVAPRLPLEGRHLLPTLRTPYIFNVVLQSPKHVKLICALAFYLWCTPKTTLYVL